MAAGRKRDPVWQFFNEVPLPTVAAAGQRWQLLFKNYDLNRVDLNQAFLLVI